MTRRRDLERHRHTLAEIRSVMHSLKTLSYIETRRLAKPLAAQNAVVAGIEAAASDFLAFHRAELPEAGPSATVLVLIGSERGFCRDFNQTLVRALDAGRPKPEPVAIIAIGRKLQPLLENDTRVVARLAGASVAGEIPRVLDAAVGALRALEMPTSLRTLSVVHHRNEGGIAALQLLPPFRELPMSPETQPPLLTLAPREFLTELVDQYLFAALHEVLYESLLAEHRARVAHLEGAVSRLDDELAAAARRGNRLRQEELIEEIEVILLNATPVAPEVAES